VFDFNNSLPDAAKLLRVAKAAYDHTEADHLRKFDAYSKAQFNGRWRTKLLELNFQDWKVLQPENPIREMIQTYLTHVLGEEVAPDISPLALGDQGQATLREYRIRRLLDDIAYNDEHDAAIVDSMHSIGCTYFGIKAGQTAMRLNDQTLDPGEAFVARIPISSLVYDPNAPSWKRKAYMGHGYVASIDVMLENGIGNEKLIRSIPKIWDNDKYGSTAVHPWAQSGCRVDEYIEDQIPLWDFTFLYRGKRFRCTLPPFDGTNEFVVPPFEDMEIEKGPYNVLELGLSTGDGIALSPAMAMMDAHLIGKAMAGRLAWEGLNTRRKVVADQGDQAFVMKLLNPNDPDGVVFTNSQNVKEVVTGGMVKELLEAYYFMQGVRKTIGPNVQLAGGQDDPGDTATGTSLLAGNAGMAFTFWRNRINRWTAGNLERLSWSLDTETGKERYDFPMPNGQSVPIVWNSNTRDTSYNQFKYSIKPSVGSSMDPRQKLRSLFEIMGAIPAFMQSVLMMGGDTQAAINAIAHVSEMPELARILPTQSTMLIQQQLMQGLAIGAANVPGMGKMLGGPAAMRGGMSGQMDQRQSDYATGRVPA